MKSDLSSVNRNKVSLSPANITVLKAETGYKSLHLSIVDLKVFRTPRSVVPQMSGSVS